MIGQDGIGLKCSVDLLFVISGFRSPCSDRQRQRQVHSTWLFAVTVVFQRGWSMKQRIDTGIRAEKRERKRGNRSASNEP